MRTEPRRFAPSSSNVRLPNRRRVRACLAARWFLAIKRRREESVQQEIETILPDEFAHATSKQGKLALARRLMEVGAGTLDDPTSRYVMFSEGRKLAIEVDDAALAFELCDRVCEEFDVDAWGLRLKTFTKLADVDKSSDLVEFGLGLVQRAIDEDRYDAAIDLATAVAKLAGEDREAPASLRDRVRAIFDRVQPTQASVRAIFQAALEKTEVAARAMRTPI